MNICQCLSARRTRKVTNTQGGNDELTRRKWRTDTQRGNEYLRVSVCQEDTLGYALDLSRPPSPLHVLFCPTELPRACRCRYDLGFHAAIAFSVAGNIASSVGERSLVLSTNVTVTEELDNLRREPSVMYLATQDHDPSVPCRCLRRHSTWSIM